MWVHENSRSMAHQLNMPWSCIIQSQRLTNARYQMQMRSDNHSLGTATTVKSLQACPTHLNITKGNYSRTDHASWQIALGIDLASKFHLISIWLSIWGICLNKPDPQRPQLVSYRPAAKVMVPDTTRHLQGSCVHVLTCERCFGSTGGRYTIHSIVQVGLIYCWCLFFCSFNIFFSYELLSDTYFLFQLCSQSQHLLICCWH